MELKKNFRQFRIGFITGAIGCIAGLLVITTGCGAPDVPREIAKPVIQESQAEQPQGEAEAPQEEAAVVPNEAAAGDETPSEETAGTLPCKLRVGVDIRNSSINVACATDTEESADEDTGEDEGDGTAPWVEKVDYFRLGREGIVVRVTFSEEVQLNFVEFSLTSSLSQQTPDERSINRNVVSFAFYEGLMCVNYTVTVSGARDLSGEPMVQPQVFGFTLDEC